MMDFRSKTVRFLIGFLAVMIAGPIGVQSGCCCPSLWTSFGQHCYRYFSYNMTWERAEQFCRGFSVPSLGSGDPDMDSLGHLVSIHSQAENDFVFTLFKSSAPKEGSKYMWIGLHDATLDGSHAWVDGTDIRYTNWIPGQPDNVGREDCSEIVNTRSGDWNDVRCTFTRASCFICKLPSWY
ncbi:echinoidin-like [Lytechinus variegatus]|uniref:echinoidin-like n=1 Tax=Lytechinus variegatus TaxID=7654 RepID=UPI001BB2789F|nr:echinoidin-like [Lytechinus variegatus]